MAATYKPCEVMSSFYNVSLQCFLIACPNFSSRFESPATLSTCALS